MCMDVVTTQGNIMSSAYRMFVWNSRKWFNYLNLPAKLIYYLQSETYEDAMNDDAFIKLLVKDIDHAHRTIKIVEGEENIKLYDDERVSDAFERAVERGVSIKFVLKPALDGVIRE